MFIEEEMQLLNQGWNYAIEPNFRAESIVIDIEGAIKFTTSDVKSSKNKLFPLFVKKTILAT